MVRADMESAPTVVIRGSPCGRRGRFYIGPSGASRTPPPTDEGERQVGATIGRPGKLEIWQTGTGEHCSPLQKLLYAEKRAAKTAVGCLEEVSPDSGSG